MKEVELRGRLVAARNGLEYALACFLSHDEESVFRRSDLFRIHPKRPSEQNDQWLNKAIRYKQWQGDYLDRAVKVGLFSREKVSRQIRYELINDRLARTILKDFDEHGQLLAKLIVPNSVEISTPFDAALSDKFPEPDPEIIDDNTGKGVPPEQVVEGEDGTVPMNANDLRNLYIVLKQTLEYIQAIASHLDEVEDKVDVIAEEQRSGFNEVEATFRNRFNKVEGAIGELASLSNAAVARLSGITKKIEGGLSVDVDAVSGVIVEGLSEALREVGKRINTLQVEVMKGISINAVSIRSLKETLNDRSVLQQALSKLKASRDDNAAAVDMLVSHLGKEKDDAKGP